MKILLINKYFYKKGGAETVFFNIIKLLEKHGHTVIPFCLKSEKNISSPYEQYFVDYPELSESSLFNKIKNTSSFFYNKNAADQLGKLIIKEKPDVAHIHLMFNSLSVSILPVLKKYNIPTIMSVHEYRLLCPAYTFTDGDRNFCERCRTGHYYNCVTHLCSKRNFINSLMLCLDSYFRAKYFPPIDYINKFLFVSRFSMNKHIQIEKRFKDISSYLYNFTPSVKDYCEIKGDYILFLGRISEEKGIVTLLDAMKKTPTIKLKLAGVGPLLEKLRSNCSTNVEFVGFQQGEELRKLIHNASFVIVPSECYENNPMTIIESYAIGTPVIGSNLGGIPEIILENKIGYTFEPKSSESLKNVIIKACSISQDEYNKMSKAAKQFARENFSEEVYYQKLMLHYQSIIPS